MLLRGTPFFTRYSRDQFDPTFRRAQRVRTHAPLYILPRTPDTREYGSSRIDDRLRAKRRPIYRLHARDRDGADLHLLLLHLS